MVSTAKKLQKQKKRQKYKQGEKERAQSAKAITADDRKSGKYTMYFFGAIVLAVAVFVAYSLSQKILHTASDFNAQNVSF